MSHDGDTFPVQLFRRTYNTGQYGTDADDQPTKEMGVVNVPVVFDAFRKWLGSSPEGSRVLDVEDSHFECGDLFESVGAPELDNAAVSKDGEVDLYQLLCFGELSKHPNPSELTLKIKLHVE